MSSPTGASRNLVDGVSASDGWSNDPDDSRSGGPPCDLYLPGHQVHYIQSRLAMADDAAADRVRATLVEVTDGHVVVRLDDGTFARYRNHATDRIRRVAAPGDELMVCERFGILGIPVSRGTSMFCLAPEGDDLRSCDEAPSVVATTESLVGQLVSRGGFIVRADQLPGLADSGTGPVNGLEEDVGGLS